MERKPGMEMVCGVEILAEQRTPLVEGLLRVIDQLLAINAQLLATVQQQQLRIEQLEEEVRRLKGLPDQPKRKSSPSPLNDPAARHRLPVRRRNRTRPTENDPAPPNAPRHES